MSVTLEDIKARCVEEGNCWLWQGGVNQRGYPMIRYEGRTTPVRRVVCILDGRPANPLQPIACTCGDKRCVRPIHMKPTTMSKVGIASAESGVLSTKAKCAKVAESRRKSPHTKLTMEKVRAIRESDETGEKLGLKYGVHQSIVHRIRRGLLWKEYAATPFAGLGARA